VIWKVLLKPISIDKLLIDGDSLMPLITFQPSGKTITVPPGTELLDAIRRAGINIEASCGGKGTCGNCRVKVISGDADSDGPGVLSRTVVAAGFVLACRTQIIDSDLTVDIPETIAGQGGQYTDTALDIQLVDPELLPGKQDYASLSAKLNIEVPEPQPGDGLSDLDRLTRRIRFDRGPETITCPLEIIREVPAALRADHGRITVTLIRQAERCHVIGLEPGHSVDRHYGIAVDIGTTTIAVQLVHLPTAEIIATASDYNSQIACGLDIISRINYARRPGRLQELQTRVLETVNRLLLQVVASHGVKTPEIGDAVIAGNTTMIHLLLGLNPEFIRLEPYTPTVLRVPYLTASEIGLKINPHAWVYISPGVGSYVGGDITAGILCTALTTNTEAVHLFIDIGTNGELVIGNGEFLMTCACSAGPAFEGGGISHGMRAALGAIERVEINEDTGIASGWTIGNVRPIGICGSGIISLLANLFRTGWVDAAGKLNRNRPSPVIRLEGRHAGYVLVPVEESGNQQELVISELDIENIIRAKAAIFSACSLMLNHIGVSFTDLRRVYIAGGFGRFLNIEESITIGLIPDLPGEKICYIGNASLMGAYMVLVSEQYRNHQLELANKMTYIDLSSEPGYMDHFTGALFLPHTDAARFPSVRTNFKK
jgi:uncharacterized 2Fe-2S/4Fe-4S cluster protein (DUF4445 family)